MATRSSAQSPVSCTALALWIYALPLLLSGAATGTLTESASVWPAASVTSTFTVQLPQRVGR